MGREPGAPGEAKGDDLCCGGPGAERFLRACRRAGSLANGEIVDAVSGQAGQFEAVSQLLATHPSLQVAVVALVAGIIGIMLVYRRLASWSLSKRFSYTRPHVSRFVRVAVLPFFAIALISSINAYAHAFELFGHHPGLSAEAAEANRIASETFAKLLNTMNILVIGYAVAHLIPIILTKREKSLLEKEDFDEWFARRGFADDDGDMFHTMYRWTPPRTAPEGMGDAEFQEKLETDEGRRHLEEYHTPKGNPIGSYEQVAGDPFEKWKVAERAKYARYLDACLSGGNESGRVLRMGQRPGEIYPIDTWREEKRRGGHAGISAGARPPGYAARKRKDMPRSVTQIMPVAIFLSVVLGVVSWWGVDLIVLATATGGLAIGIGFALQETMQNWFAYIMIRKDKIMVEGDRVLLDTGYNGYVHKITARVTYVRHAMNESFATIPTRQLVNAQIINYTRGAKLVPVTVEVGVSYLNDPRQVAAILMKVGRRTMREAKSASGKHLVRQKRCPYIEENRPSCGCDKGLHVDITQPVVRFNHFNDSALDFALWVYVKSYGDQFALKSDMRMIMYEEFKRYDIRIPWPIRTVYQGDEKKEAKEIGALDAERDRVVREYGMGDITAGGEEDE